MFSEDDQICKKDRIIESLELPKIAGSNFQISDLAAPPRSNSFTHIDEKGRFLYCRHLYYYNGHT